MAANCIAAKLLIDKNGGKHGGAVYQEGSPRSRLQAPRERCYNSAEQIPIAGGDGSKSRGSAVMSSSGSSANGSSANSRGFALHDEGGHKGVKKLGYVSHHIGDTMMLGPLELPVPGTAFCCRHVRVRLGYLISTHGGAGAMHLKCVGACTCRPVKSTFLRATYPFPLVQTGARYNSVVTVPEDENVTMTAFTIFIALMEGAGPQPCHLRINHVKGHPQSKEQHSRVRIDSLALMRHGGSNNETIPCYAR